MNKTVVCSVGTSSAKGICKPADLGSWVAAQGGPEPAAEQMAARIRHVEPSGDALRDTLSAEIHSLVRIGFDQFCRVILLSSASVGGECLNDLNPLANRDPFRFLERVAGSEEAFKQAEHINVGQGLRWLKPGRTTDLVSQEGWRLLVWRAIREDQVGPDYASRVLVDPQRDRVRLGPFTRMDLHR